MIAHYVLICWLVGGGIIQIPYTDKDTCERAAFAMSIRVDGARCIEVK